MTPKQLHAAVYALCEVSRRYCLVHEPSAFLLTYKRFMEDPERFRRWWTREYRATLTAALAALRDHRRLAEFFASREGKTALVRAELELASGRFSVETAKALGCALGPIVTRLQEQAYGPFPMATREWNRQVRSTAMLAGKFRKAARLAEGCA